MGASLSKLIQAVSWQTEMGARRRPLMSLCSLPLVLGARGRPLCPCVVCPLVVGARGRPLCPCVVCPLVVGARGRLSYSSTCCLSPSILREAPGRVRGRHVSGVCLVYRVGQVSVDSYAWLSFTLKS